MFKYFLVAITVILVGLIGWAIKTYNNFVRYNNDVEEGFSTMDVCLKKRFDLIPNLIETVKGYAKHEKDTLQSVVDARTSIMSATTDEERLKAENALSGTLKSLFAVAEAYPDLKANQNFLDLQQQLGTVETEIANARRYYNAVVKTFNNSIAVFPSSILAGIFGYSKKPMYEVDTEEERQNVKVQF